eukprot:scaffold65762_cov60-Phaeocystis_antarctica.AAC.8
MWINSPLELPRGLHTSSARAASPSWRLAFYYDAWDLRLAGGDVPNPKLINCSVSVAMLRPN